MAGYLRRQYTPNFEGFYVPSQIEDPLSSICAIASASIMDRGRLYRAPC